MNEKAIKELYWEFRTRGIKLNKKLSELEEVEKKKLTKRLRELSNLVKQLSVKAEEKGIDLKDKTGITVVDDASDDWTQLLGISSLPKGVKGVLKAKIENLGTIPTANQMNSLLKFCEKYYNQNITKLTKERAIKSFEKNKGTYTNQDIDRIITDYKKAAKVTLSESIKKLDTSFQLQMAEVQPIFDSYHSGAKVMEGDTNNDWKIQIKESDLLQEIKQALEQKITTLATPPTPKQMRILLGNMDKYYQANVGQVNEAELIKTYEQHEGRYTDQELDGIAEKHKKAAISAIMGQIDSLGTDFSFDEKAAHDAFVAIYSGQRLLDSTTSGMENVPIQLKIDIKEWSLGNGGMSVRFIKATEPLAQLSGKVSIWKTAHWKRMSNEDIITELGESYTQFFRNTLSFSDIFQKGLKGATTKMSTNIFSKGTEFTTPIKGLKLVMKTDLGSLNWNTLFKNMSKESTGKSSLSLGAVRLVGNLNMLDIIPSMKKWPIQRALISISLGFNLSLDPVALSDFVDVKYKKKNKLKPGSSNSLDVDKKDRGFLDKLKKELELDDINLVDNIDKDDVKVLKELRGKTDDLVKSSAEMRDAINDIQNSKTNSHLKNTVSDFKNKADDLYKHYKDKIWKSDVAKETAEKLLEKAGGWVAEEIGEHTLKVAAKWIGKGVPMIGAGITIYELFCLGRDIYTWLNEGDLPWEEKVAEKLIEIGNSINEIGNSIMDLIKGE